MKFEWDENKNKINIQKHGLDFADAHEVLESRYRWDVQIVRNGELRTQSISYALGFLAVLSLVHTARDEAIRVISFRAASKNEREAYYEWLENECDE